jgi:hypothetical protein
MEPPASLGNSLIQRLDSGAGPDVEIRDDALRARLQSADSDRLGIMVIAVTFTGLAGSIQAADLREQLLHLTETVDYLSEPLQLVEHDPARTGALLRSAEVRQVGPDREYFEMRVERNRDTVFSRLRQPPGGSDRTQVPFLLARETLARLVDDLAAALNT